MSKSLGNTIDPLQMIDKLGADAIRYSLISITATGQDVYLSESKFLIGRNLANKIWNSFRFLLNIPLDNKLKKKQISFGDILSDKNYAILDTVDKWILYQMDRTIVNITQSLNEFRFNEAASEIYEFFWHKFCDWYLEMCKPHLYQGSDDIKNLKYSICMGIFKTCLKLFHPFMPFITEYIWQELVKRKMPEVEGDLIVSAWPVSLQGCDFYQDNSVIERFIDIITTIRHLRTQFDIPLNSSIDIYISSNEPLDEKLIQLSMEYISVLSGPSDITIGINLPGFDKAAVGVAGGCQIFFPLEGIVDFEQERKRIERKIAKHTKMLNQCVKKINSREFLEKAPKDVVEKQKQKVEELKSAIEELDNIHEIFR